MEAIRYEPNAMNEHDIKDISNMDQPFPRIRMELNVTTMNPAKMNVIITPVITKDTRNIMDFTLLVSGASLNVLLALVIALNPRMHTSANCYVMSLVLSNILILMEPLQQVLDWSFNIKFEVNLNYVFLVSFATFILALILLNVETYVVVCQKSSALHKQMLKISTAVKCILYVWITSVMTTAMELHLYLFFEEEVINHIIETSIIMFLIFPCLLFILLHSFILYDLIMSKLMDGTWPSKDTERFTFLIGVTDGYLLTLIPFRVLSVITLITDSCCSDLMIDIVYMIFKMHPLILPITCFAISKQFRQAIKEMLTCRRDAIFVT